MQESMEWLRELVLNYPAFKYIVIFLGSAFGGELALITLSFLAAQKIFQLFPFLLVSFLGVFTGDALWFYLGRTNVARKIISHRYTHYTISVIMEALKRLSRGHHILAFVLAKFVVGTRAVIIFYVSKTGINFWDFMRHNLVAILVWLVVVDSIGYISGLGFVYFSKVLENIYAGVGFILLVAIILLIAQAQLKKFFLTKKEGIKEEKM